jgi:CelD/BcsL family acetyltransferase involved in cellulose biosynthesis
MNMMITKTPGLARDGVVAVEPDFDFQSSEYCALFARSDLTPFQSPLWLASIHRDLAPALGARQHTVTVRDRASRELLAVLPLVIQRLGLLKVIQPADFGVCDANAVVGETVVLEALARDPRLRQELRASLKGAGALLFRKVRRDGFDVRRLFDGVATSVGENAGYHSDTGDDFEHWERKKLNSQFTKKLGQLRRQIERDFGGYDIRLARTEGEIKDAFALLQRVNTGRFESSLLDDPVFADFYRNYAIAGAASGQAQTNVFYVKDEPMAVLFGIAHGDQCHMMLIGSDMDRMGKFSLGLQIYHAVIKQRFEAGLQRLDFGLGNSGYKSRFRVEETLLDNFSVSRSPAGLLMTTVYHRSKPLKNRLRRFAERLR